MHYLIFQCLLCLGLPEAVVAAALSRVGHKVLHLDRYCAVQIHTCTCSCTE